MPPKKKGDGKKSGKKNKATDVRVNLPIPEPLSEGTKEYYLVQITDLEKRLARYQHKCDILEVGNSEFEKKFDQLVTDKREIVAFWKRQVEQRTDEIADMNDRMVGLQQAKDSEKEIYEGQLQQLRTEFQETRDQLTSENMMLGGKLASLEEFKVQKEDLMAKFAEMEQLLADNQSTHKDTIYDLERKAVIDKDRLKKDMVLRVNQVAAEFRKVSNKQMAETTKRTIRENVSINSQLAKMSDKTVEIIEENDSLRGKEKTHKRQIQLLEENEKELAKKNYSNTKIIRMLTEKCQHQEMIINELENIKEVGEKTRFELDQLTTEFDNIKIEHDTLQSNFDKETLDMHELTITLEKERKDRLKIEKVLKETSDAIKLALQVADTDELGRRIECRDAMLEHILVLMNSAASIGIGVDPAEFGPDYDTIQTRYATIPGSGKGIRRGEMTKSPIAGKSAVLSHYKLGDLGLIPRPKQSIPTSMDRMRLLSSTSRLGQLKKVLTRSIAVQTNGIPRSFFNAEPMRSTLSAEKYDSSLNVSSNVLKDKKSAAVS